MKKGWEVKKLGEVCDIDKSQGMFYALPYVGLEHIESNTARFLGLRVSQSVKSSTFKFSDEHILYGRLRPYLNKVLAPDFEGHCSTEIFPIKPCRALSREYLLYWLLADETCVRINATCTGARMPRAQMNEVMGFEIPIPPLAEQQRIVSILDEAFEGIAIAKANAEKNLKNARDLFDSQLESVFSQRGEGWVEKSVAQLVEEGILAKPFDGNHGEIHPKKADYAPSGVPFIMACDLVNGSVDTQGCTFISRKQADSLRVGFANDGDVLISHKGTIGRSAILKTKNDYVMLTPQVTSYRVMDFNKISNRFIRYYFMSPIFLSEMMAGAADGSTRAYIGITKQLGLRFRFPPMSKQRMIVAELDELYSENQRLAALYTRKIAALEELKKSLLHEAFRGEL